MTPRLRAESTGESMKLLGRWMVGWLLNLESCCNRPKMRNSVLEELKTRNWKTSSYSVFKVSDVMRNPELRMIRKVEYHQHRGDGLL